MNEKYVIPGADPVTRTRNKANVATAMEAGEIPPTVDEPMAQWVGRKVTDAYTFAGRAYLVLDGYPMEARALPPAEAVRIMAEHSARKALSRGRELRGTDTPHAPAASLHDDLARPVEPFAPPPPADTEEDRARREAIAQRSAALAKMGVRDKGPTAGSLGTVERNIVPLEPGAWSE